MRNSQGYLMNVKSLKTLIWLFITGLAVRVSYYLLFSNEIVVNYDAAQYIALARKIAGGDFYGGLHPYWSPFYPFLVGLAAFFSDSAILPALIVSIIAGSLAVPLTFLLAEQSHGRREAVIAAVLALCYPHLLNTVLDLGTENVYLVLINLSLIIGWKGLKENLTKSFFAVGVLVGLAYLTRPEAFGYLFFFILVIGLKNLRASQLISRKLSTQLIALTFGFALLAAPYVLYLRSTTGSWTISAKVNNNALAGNYGQTFFSGAEELSGTSGTVSETGKVILQAVFVNFHSFHKKLPFLVPPFLLVLMAIGFFRTNWDRERLGPGIYLLFFCLLTVTGYVLTVVEINYFYVLLPISFGWMAGGIVELENWIKGFFKGLLENQFLLKKGYFTVPAIIILNLYVLPLNNFMRPPDGAWQWSSYEQRDAGLWLKENIGIDRIILSKDFRPAFYADGKFVSLKTPNLDQIIVQCKENKADFIVFDERNLKDAPGLRGFVDGTEIFPGLEVVYHSNPQPGYQISIYKVVK